VSRTTSSQALPTRIARRSPGPMRVRLNQRRSHCARSSHLHPVDQFLSRDSPSRYPRRANLGRLVHSASWCPNSGIAGHPPIVAAALRSGALGQSSASSLVQGNAQKTDRHGDRSMVSGLIPLSRISCLTASSPAMPKRSLLRRYIRVGRRGQRVHGGPEPPEGGDGPPHAGLAYMPFLITTAKPLHRSSLRHMHGFRWCQVTVSKRPSERLLPTNRVTQP
jgi:hypothetical protein